MPTLTDTDISVAVVIAILIIIFVLCVWPGYARVRVADIEGSWASQSGDLYKISARPDISARAVSILGAGQFVNGELHHLRRLRVGDNEGYIGFDDGNITWSRRGPLGGDVWIPQGVRKRR